MRNYILLFSILFIAACSTKAKKLSAQEIIDKTMIVSGADKVANATLEFDFRDKHYIAIRKQNGRFNLIRNQQNQQGENISDMISNAGFRREFNGHPISVIDSLAKAYESSVNSVHYFSVLPYGLNDAAVKKQLLPETTINSKPYYKVQIRFSEDGGGEDFEDVFVYWIAKETFTIDYLAYSFHVNDGGMRFREAKNERVINGIRFVDYNNYKPTNASAKLESLDKAFENHELIKISEINLENVQATLLD